MLARFLPNTRPGHEIFSPAFTNFLIASLARNLILETELGLLPNLEEIELSIHRLLDSLGC